MNPRYKNYLIWGIIFVVLMVIFRNQVTPEQQATTYQYSQFLSAVDKGQVQSVTIDGRVIRGKSKDNKAFVAYMPLEDPQVVHSLVSKGVQVNGKPPVERGFLATIFFQYIIPFGLIFLLWILFMRYMQGGGKGGPMSFGRSKAKMLTGGQVKVTFADVAGVDEAKHEVSEVVDFLRDPGKFQKLGGRIPTGVLLVGSPGTGKTMLAKAVAGEAKVPFFTISGSDFVEMFVGVGASRVRDMFEQAKKQAPCIIFIDEIDAVGRQRGAGLGGGHDEREQTLNQLLVEMDGFLGSEGVIVMAATNRPDVLDPALLRPGRFDRQVVVPLPDLKGREKILEVHMQKLPLADDAKASYIARGTPGFSGADLANLVNEAALFAARANHTKVGMKQFEQAKDKLIMGAERRSMVMSEDEKKLTAYHEAGHAIIGLKVPDHDPVYKVSIIPRGRALGVTMFLPETDRYSYSRQRLMSSIKSLFGGRLAELIIFGRDHVTTGASNDIERATDMARNMVTKWGLSDKLGPLTYQEDEGEVFLGRSMQRHREVSDTTVESIDAEVRSIIDECYQSAEKILRDNMDTLHLMSKALMLYETIDESQIKQIMAGEEPSPPEGWEELQVDEQQSTASNDATTDAATTKVDADKLSDDKQDGVAEQSTVDKTKHDQAADTGLDAKGDVNDKPKKNDNE